MRLIHPEAGKIEQGSVFNCAVVPGYADCKCWGIILTARCDLAHGKYSVINYLPVVRFSDWLLRGSINLLSRRMLPELQKEISQQLQKKGVSEKLRSIFPLEDIIRKETNGEEQRALLEKCANLKVLLDLPHTTGLSTLEAKGIIRAAGKKCDKLVEELIEQKLGEYYFLESVDVYDQPNDGYVILLRDFRSMECDLSQRIANGYSLLDFAQNQKHASVLTFEHDPICLVTGVLRSPDVEHLVQQFSNLFIRIGLEDHSEQTVLRHQRLIKLV